MNCFILKDINSIIYEQSGLSLLFYIMQRAIERTKADTTLLPGYYQTFSQNFNKLGDNLMNQIRKLETIKQKCEKDFSQAMISKKVETKQQETLSLEKCPKIKKSKNSKKKKALKPIVQSKQHILLVINRLMSRYTAEIAKNSLVFTSKLIDKSHQANIFVTVMKYLEEEYQKFQKEFERQLNMKRDQIDFGHFFEFQNPLPGQFCAMIFRSFPELKKYIQQFDQSTLSPLDISKLRQFEDSIIPIMLQQEDDLELQQDSCQIDFSLLKRSDGQISAGSRNKRKNKKRKNKKKNSKANKSENNTTCDVQMQNEFQIEKIIQQESRLDQQTKFQQIMNLIQNLDIKQNQRVPCNVTEQWQNKYLNQNSLQKR